MRVSVPATPSENRLLAALSLDEYQRLLPQDVGAISYVRGRIKILDRLKMEETSASATGL